MKIHPSVQRLQTILPRPAKPIYTGNASKWQGVKDDLGIQFPADYKSFINVYGQGVIDNEITLHNPFAPRKGVYPHNYSFQLQDFQMRFAVPPLFPEPIWPDKNGPLPLGNTGFSNEICWRTKGSPRQWTILIFHERSDEYLEFDMGIVEFLYSFLSRELDPGLPPYKPKPPFLFAPEELECPDPG